jgi:hypothetical protein
MLHYHGTPITPMAALYQLAGRLFCVSFAKPQDVTRCHQIGQGVVLDNGAYSVWRAGLQADWPAYYEWADQWLDYPTTWAVIPDVIEGDAEQNDALLAQWPHGEKGAPVWHMHEPLDRLIGLSEEWPRLCIGSSSEYAVVLSEGWERRMDQAWNALAHRHARTPNVHMLRGMACSGRRWPFASVDSTDIARNHNRPQNTPMKMVERWDAIQCPARWEARPQQDHLFGLEVA